MEASFPFFFFLLETKLKRGEGKKMDAEMGF
jgi:hypothetical protein